MLVSGAGTDVEVRGRLIGLAEKLGVAVAESPVPDAELVSDEIRKYISSQISSRKAQSNAASHLPHILADPMLRQNSIPFVSPSTHPSL